MSEKPKAQSENWWHKKSGDWQIVDIGPSCGGTRSATLNESLLLDRITDQEFIIERLREENEQLQSRLQALEGPEDHPEHRCDRCGGRNIESWYADSDVWNQVASDFSILCPICFAELAEALGIAPAAWRLSIEGDDPEVNKLRVVLHSRPEELTKQQVKIEQLQSNAATVEDFMRRVLSILSVDAERRIRQCEEWRHALDMDDVVQAARRGES